MIRSGGVVGERVCVAALERSTVQAMYRLHRRYFDEHPYGVFVEDLAEKQEVILLMRDASLVGFSTVQVGTEQVGDRTIGVFFSGDTIVDRADWGSTALLQCWMQAAQEARLRIALPLYWLLLSSGYRTYRFLPTFFREFWPRFDRDTPPETAALMAALAARRFGSRYRDGIVRLPGGYLRAGIAPNEDARRSNPHVAFFDRVNPGHVRGDELVCLAPVYPDNYTPAGLRLHCRACPDEVV